MSYAVHWGEAVARKAQDRFGSQRSPQGRANHHDFVCGPLAAAAERCRDFDSLPEEVGPSVRSVWVVDPVFGPVVFIAVLTGDGVVALVDFQVDPGYWELAGEDPDDA